MKLSRIVLVLLAACGGGSSPDVDGGLTDPDGAVSPDAALSAVTIHLYEGHQPVAGRAVAFLKPDDSVISETVTDATGTASAPMPAGGSVSVAGAGVVNGTVYTYLGVKNGQELTIGTPTPATSTPFQISVTIPAGEQPTAQNFMVNATCNINASNESNLRTLDMMVRAGCTTADFYAATLDSSLHILSTAWRPAQPVSAGATVSVGTTFTPPMTSTLSITNAPQFATITPALDLVVGTFYPVPPPFNTDITITGGAGTKALTHANITGASLESRVQISNLGSQFWVKRGAPGTVALDLTAANLPLLATQVDYSATAAAVTWTETGHTVDTSAAKLVVRNGTARNFTRLVVGAHTGESLHVPHLPASLDQFNAAAADTVTATAVIGSFPGGYDRIISKAFVEGFDFFDSFYALDRRNAWGYVLADGDVAMFASSM
ncbi:MAG TPA: hypothetical protein VGM90_28430 [Kofleriaceae bacterium]|jgi:hypothetical protein